MNMKLRVRHGDTRTTVVIEEQIPRLSHLKQAIKCEFNLSSSAFFVSLNGKDAIVIDGDPALSSVGIVSGDLIFVVDSNANEGGHLSLDDQTLQQLVQMGFDKDEILAAMQVAKSPNVDDIVECLTAQQKMSSMEDTIVTSSEERAPQTHAIQALAQTTTDSSEDVTAEDMPQLGHYSGTVLCRDGIPHLLESLYTQSCVSTLHEAVCIVCQVLMVESGFQLVGNKLTEEQNKVPNISGIDTQHFSAAFDDSGIKKLNYRLPQAAGLVCTVCLTSLGNFIMIHGFISNVKDCSIFQTRLEVTDFVKTSVPLKQGAAGVYQNLHKLSRVFKDNISLPLISSARSYLGLPDLQGLMALPVEVKLKIFLMLDIRSILILSEVCKDLHLLLNDDNFWRHLLQRDFKITSEDCKKCYVRCYKEKMNQRRMVIPPTQPLPVDPTAGRFQPEFPAGIIGGAYDLFPERLGPPFLPHPNHGDDVYGPRPRFDPFMPDPDNMGAFDPRPGLRPRPSRRPQPSRLFPRFM